MPNVTIPGTSLGLQYPDDWTDAQIQDHLKRRVLPRFASAQPAPTAAPPADKGLGFEDILPAAFGSTLEMGTEGLAGLSRFAGDVSSTAIPALQPLAQGAQHFFEGINKPLSAWTQAHEQSVLGRISGAAAPIAAMVGAEALPVVGQLATPALLGAFAGGAYNTAADAIDQYQQKHGPVGAATKIGVPLGVGAVSAVVGKLFGKGGAETMGEALAQAMVRNGAKDAGEATVESLVGKAAESAIADPTNKTKMAKALGWAFLKGWSKDIANFQALPMVQDVGDAIYDQDKRNEILDHPDEYAAKFGHQLLDNLAPAAAATVLGGAVHAWIHPATPPPVKPVEPATQELGLVPWQAPAGAPPGPLQRWAGETSGRAYAMPGETAEAPPTPQAPLGLPPPGPPVEEQVYPMPPVPPAQVAAPTGPEPNKWGEPYLRDGEEWMRWDDGTETRMADTRQYMGASRVDADGTVRTPEQMAAERGLPVPQERTPGTFYAGEEGVAAPEERIEPMAGPVEEPALFGPARQIEASQVPPGTRFVYSEHGMIPKDPQNWFPGAVVPDPSAVGETLTHGDDLPAATTMTAANGEDVPVARTETTVTPEEEAETARDISQHVSQQGTPVSADGEGIKALSRLLRRRNNGQQMRMGDVPVLLQGNTRLPDALSYLASMVEDPERIHILRDVKEQEAAQRALAVVLGLDPDHLSAEEAEQLQSDAAEIGLSPANGDALLLPNRELGAPLTRNTAAGEPAADTSELPPAEETALTEPEAPAEKPAEAAPQAPPSVAEQFRAERTRAEQAAPQPVPEENLGGLTKAIRDKTVIDTLLKEMKRVGFAKRVPIAFVESLRAHGDMQAMGGYTKLGQGVGQMLIALRSFDQYDSLKQIKREVVGVVHHEMLHAARHMGLLTEHEFQSLLARAKVARYVDPESGEKSFMPATNSKGQVIGAMTPFEYAQHVYGAHLPKAEVEEEAVAALLQDTATDLIAPDIKTAGMLNRFTDFFLKTRKALDNAGFRKPEDILSDFEAGRIAERTGDRQGGEAERLRSMGSPTMAAAQNLMRLIPRDILEKELKENGFDPKWLRQIPREVDKNGEHIREKGWAPYYKTYEDALQRNGGNTRLAEQVATVHANKVARAIIRRAYDRVNELVPGKFDKKKGRKVGGMEAIFGSFAQFKRDFPRLPTGVQWHKGDRRMAGLEGTARVDKYWYEHAREMMPYVNWDEIDPKDFTTVMAVTSGGNTPYQNLQRALVVKSQQVRGEPVDIGGKVTAPLSDYVMTGQTDTPKFYTFGNNLYFQMNPEPRHVTEEPELPKLTTDTWTGKSLRVPLQQFGAGRRGGAWHLFSHYLHQYAAGEHNALVPNRMEQRYAPHQLQAGMWGHIREKDPDNLAPPGDHYGLAMQRVHQRLVEEGILKPGEPIGLKALRNPRLIRVLSPGEGEYRKALRIAAEVKRSRDQGQINLDTAVDNLRSLPEHMKTKEVHTLIDSIDKRDATFIGHLGTPLRSVVEYLYNRLKDPSGPELKGKDLIRRHSVGLGSYTSDAGAVAAHNFQVAFHGVPEKYREQIATIAAAVLGKEFTQDGVGITKQEALPRERAKQANRWAIHIPGLRMNRIEAQDLRNAIGRDMTIYQGAQSGDIIHTHQPWGPEGPSEPHWTKAETDTLAKQLFDDYQVVPIKEDRSEILGDKEYHTHAHIQDAARRLGFDRAAEADTSPAAGLAGAAQPIERGGGEPPSGLERADQKPRTASERLLDHLAQLKGEEEESEEPGSAADESASAKSLRELRGEYDQRTARLERDAVALLGERRRIDARRSTPKNITASRPEPGTAFAIRRANVTTRQLAEEYKRENGIDKPRMTDEVPVSVPLLKRAADAYDNLRHEPDNPKVQAAYAALHRETEAQYRKMGVTTESWHGEGEPYKNSDAMMDDVENNHHLWFLPTEHAYGQADALDYNHPMLKRTDTTDKSGRRMLLNDLFRIVHDYFGHTQNGYQFGPRGEFNAYLEHSRMYSDEAKPALASETLGQNAWVNYGRHMRRADDTIPKKGDPDFIPQNARPFAEQKAAILPDSLLREVDEHAENPQTNSDAPATLYATRRFHPSTSQAHQELMNERTGLAPEREDFLRHFLDRSWWRRRTSKAYSNFVDAYSMWRKAEQELAGQQGKHAIEARNSAYRLASQLNYGMSLAENSEDGAGAPVYHKQTDGAYGTTRLDGQGGFWPTVAPIFKNGVRREFNSYMAYRRAKAVSELPDERRVEVQLDPGHEVDKNGVITKAGTYQADGATFDERNPQWAAMAKEFEQKHPYFRATYDKLQDLNSRFLKYALDTGLISRDYFRHFMSYGEYVPFKDLDEHADGKTAGAGKSISNLKSDLHKRLTSGELRKTYDPLQMLMENHRNILVRGMKNAAANAGLDLFRAGAGNGKFAFLDAAGKPLIHDLQGNAKVGKDEHKFYVWANGEKKWFSTADQDLFETFIGMHHAAQINPLIRKVFGGFTQMLRLGVIKAPTWIFRNILRDIPDAYNLSGQDFNYVTEPLKAVSAAFGLKNQWNQEYHAIFDEMKRLGIHGGQRSLFSNPDAATAFEKRAALHSGAGPDATAWRSWSNKVTQKLHHINELVERTDMIGRSLVFKAALKATGDYAYAAHRASEVAPFQRSGSGDLAQWARIMIPFFNARVQGLNVLGRALKGTQGAEMPAVKGGPTRALDPKQLQKRIALQAGLMTVGTMVYAALSKGQPYYENASDDKRDTSWMVPVGGGYALNIPTPFEYGLMFKTVPERLARVFLRDPKDPSRSIDTPSQAFWDVTRQSFGQLQFNPIPQAIRPALETAVNKDLYRGTPIVPQSLQNLEPEMQVQPGQTSVLSQFAMNKVINPIARAVGLSAASPMYLDHLLNGYLAGAGLMGLQTIDAIANNFGDTKQPKMRLSDYPGMASVFTRPDGGYRLQQFYTLESITNAAVNSLRQTPDADKPAFMESHQRELQVAHVLTKMGESLRELHAAQNATLRSPDLSAAEKRQTLDQIRQQQLQVVDQIPIYQRFVETGERPAEWEQ